MTVAYALRLIQIAMERIGTNKRSKRGGIDGLVKIPDRASKDVYISQTAHAKRRSRADFFPENILTRQPRKRIHKVANTRKNEYVICSFLYSIRALIEKSVSNSYGLQGNRFNLIRYRVAFIPRIQHHNSR